jgi:hypothetical protein
MLSALLLALLLPCSLHSAGKISPVSPSAHCGRRLQLRGRVSEAGVAPATHSHHLRGGGTGDASHLPGVDEIIDQQHTSAFEPAAASSSTAASSREQQHSNVSLDAPRPVQSRLEPHIPRAHTPLTQPRRGPPAHVAAASVGEQRGAARPSAATGRVGGLGVCGAGQQGVRAMKVQGGAGAGSGANGVGAAGGAGGGWGTGSMARDASGVTGATATATRVGTGVQGSHVGDGAEKGDNAVAAGAAAAAAGVDGGVVGVGGGGKTERGDKDKDKGDKDTDKGKDKRPMDGGGKEGAGGWAAAGKEKDKFQFDPKMLTGADNRSTGGEDQEKELEMVEAALRALVEEQPSNVTAIMELYSYRRVVLEDDLATEQCNASLHCAVANVLKSQCTVSFE